VIPEAPLEPISKHRKGDLVGRAAAGDHEGSTAIRFRDHLLRFATEQVPPPELRSSTPNAMDRLEGHVGFGGVVMAVPLQDL
jgi:hypothetical protein